MFEKLVVSSNQKRRKRTLRYFCLTSIAYFAVASGILIVSVMAADPELNLSEAQNRLVVPILPPKLGSQTPRPVQGSSSSGGAAPSRNFQVLRPLDNILNNPLPQAPPSVAAGPPRPGNVDLGSGPGVEWGVPNGGPDLTNRLPQGGDHSEPPPPLPAPVAQSTRQAPTIVSVPSSILQGKAITRDSPPYPPLAKQARLQGTVSVEIIIAPDGRVESARVVSGHALFADISRTSALRWRFAPTVLNGVAVRATGIITFNFRLNE